MLNVDALIATARTLVVERPSDEVMDAVRRSPPINSMIVWTYEILGNDRTEFYKGMIDHQIAMCGRLGMFPHIAQAPSASVDMFERCKAMCWWMQHTEVPTAFLDNDAFPNADLRPVFDQIQHVGLTVRNTPGLMPVNEGVIFAKPTDEARRFFLSYLGTYEALKPTMRDIDWRWWGGQLALNAVSQEHATLLDCNTYNFSPDEPETRETLDSKLIIHCKGNRKVLFDQVVAYQTSRPCA